MKSNQAIMDAALALPDKDRLKLVKRLLDTLPTQDLLHKEWIEKEILSRSCPLFGQPLNAIRWSCYLAAFTDSIFRRVKWASTVA